MQHERHRVPVTALAFWSDDVILTGEGSHLNAYDRRDKKLLATLQLFHGQSIHGIAVPRAPEGPSVLVWGGPYICRVELVWSDDHVLLRKGDGVEADDWILDASVHVSDEGGASKVALVTAHNALCIADFGQSGLTWLLQRAVHGSNCILYCAHVIWLSPSHCLIASGTAFGDVIVWSSHLSEQHGEISATSQTHYTFCAHEGSVFGVRIAEGDIAESLGRRGHVLASCSDDRTVRLWDVSDLDVQSASLSEEQQRETGFGSRPKAGSHSPPCLGRAMGHISRIWHVRFIQTSDHTRATRQSVRLLSFGEDATCITWLVREDEGAQASLPYALEQTHVQRAHGGKHIWSVAEYARWIATGGADGAVAVQTIEAIACKDGPTRLDRISMDDGSCVGTFRSYSFISPAVILGITDRGKVILIELTAGEAYSAREVVTGETRLEGYSTMASVPGMAFFAGSYGLVHAYSLTSRTSRAIIKSVGKVQGLFPQVLPDTSQLALLVTNIGSNVATLHRADTSMTDEVDDATGFPALYDLELPQNFIVTSFALWQTGEGGLAILGSRAGRVCIFRIGRTGATRVKMASIFCENIHAKESVTSLCVFEKAKSATGVPLIFSTGRDGTYAAHEIRESADELQLTTVHQLSLPFGPNIEGMGFSVEEKLWVWGFRGKHFVVFDIGAQRETMSVDCGGVHRSWIFQPGVGGGTFIWTKASNLYFAHQHHLPFTSLRAGGHGREIKSVASSPTHSCLVATGGEDTDIKLSLYEGGEWRCLHTIQKHNTGIQHLQWSQDGNHLFSSGGFREFFVWRIRFDVPELHVGVVCQSAHPDSGTSDLRIMSFDVSDERPTGAFHIAMVYSDSTIRTWHYRAAEGWTLRTTGDYLTSCLTQCLRLAPGQMSTASTDGCVTRWREDGESRRIEWTSRHVLHQNAILSVLRCVGDDGSELCITGGDDNALGISRVDPTGRFDTLVIPRAHAAAVTGLAMVRRGPGQVYFASAGVDQRIKLWEVRLEVGNVGVDGIAVRLRRNVSTAVADVSGMEAVRLPDGSLGVLVCGVGMDVWRIESAFLDKSINW